MRSFGTLAERPHQPAVEVDIGEREADELGDPQAGAVEHLEDGARSRRAMGSSPSTRSSSAVSTSGFGERLGQPGRHARVPRRRRRVELHHALVGQEPVQRHGDDRAAPPRPAPGPGCAVAT